MFFCNPCLQDVLADSDFWAAATQPRAELEAWEISYMLMSLVTVLTPFTNYWSRATRT
ncbi:MAG: hypothetical protein LBN24_02360 [Mediterranea sp.]|nr:hypothetical protein [Mediterranea sp.]